jgi:hypothetical protein
MCLRIYVQVCGIFNGSQCVAFLRKENCQHLEEEGITSPRIGGDEDCPGS